MNKKRFLACFLSGSNFAKDILSIKKFEIWLSFCGTFESLKTKRIEYIREEFKESLGMNFVSPFQPEREFKVYKSCKCSQIICSRVH